MKEVLGFLIVWIIIVIFSVYIGEWFGNSYSYNVDYDNICAEYNC